MPLSSLLVDHSHALAAQLDLRAEGFTQLFSPGAIAPTADLLVAIATPYDADIVRRRDFDPHAMNQPAIMAAGFPDRHPQRWLDHVTRDGLFVIVLPDLAKLHGQLSLETLQPSWCALASVTTAW